MPARNVRRSINGSIRRAVGNPGAMVYGAKANLDGSMLESSLQARWKSSPRQVTYATPTVRLPARIVRTERAHTDRSQRRQRVRAAHEHQPISNFPGVSRPMSLTCSLLIPSAISPATSIARPSGWDGLPVCPRSVPSTKCSAPTALMCSVDSL